MKNVYLKLLTSFILLLITSCSTSSFFYAPSKEFANYPDSTFYTIEEINFKASNGNNLNGCFFKPKNKSIIGSVLQLHGNAGNISYQYQFTEPLIKAGFQVNGIRL